jgi:hypothetical protein
MMKQRNRLTAVIYAIASVADSALLISRTPDVDVGWAALLALWAISCSIPLLFVFACPRFFFADSAPQTRRRRAAVLHGVAALSATALFPILALPFWKNPVRDLGDSVAVVIIPLLVLTLFLVSAVSLLVKGKSSLTTVASLLLWPYWLLLALLSTGRFFQDTPFHAMFYFPFFLTPILFAFAAGLLSYRPTLAHVAALAGIMSGPWIYWNLMKDSALGNIWLVFNLPDSGLKYYPTLYPRAVILFVGLIAFAVATAGLRLLPSRWLVRRSPLRDRTWPAIAASLAILGIWFSQSVMPYRLPGAVDYFDWPILQILHIEKHGLQFHEACVTIWGRRGLPTSVSFSGNDRRLFRYRFNERYASGQLPEPLVERVRAIIPSADQGRRGWDKVGPIRSWNADDWYFITTGSGLKAYTKVNGSTPPQEIVALFDDLEKLPQSAQTESDSKDVCLGFCYDPLSELGFLFANHRCSNAGSGTVCR